VNDPDKFLNIVPEDLDIRRVRILKSSAVEEAVVIWVLQMQHTKRPINGPLIVEKAKQFAAALGKQDILEFSNGWLFAFCKRNGFRQFKIHGESGDVDMTGFEKRIARLKAKIKEYDLRDIYNMDETALFYNMCPDKTIARQQIEGSKKVC
jgi:Tc5 transposase DNA-binding domain